jgi:hypothetical protein
MHWTPAISRRHQPGPLDEQPEPLTTRPCFKAARRAARAANTAASPGTPLGLPPRRRQRRSAGAKSANPGPLLIYDSLRVHLAYE